jgi:lysophospholipase L1-like esterase
MGNWTPPLAGAWVLLAALQAPAAEPQWIWNQKEAATKAAAGDCYFRKTFNLDDPESGTIEITADNSYELFVNSRSVGAGDAWNTRQKYDISPLLLPGRNVIAVKATNAGPDPAGLAAKVVVTTKGKPAMDLSTDGTWKVNTKVPGSWARLESNDAQWPAAVALGEYGKAGPWGKAVPATESQSSIVLNKARAVEKGHFQLRDGDRVVFLGSAFIERLQARNDLETILTSAYPQRNITYRNLGWSGDTVWGDARGVFGGRTEGFKRLINDVAICQPTLLVVCYGENEAYDGDEGLAEFQSGVAKLLDALEKTGARILLLGPRRHENVGAPFPKQDQYNDDLKKYTAVIADAAKERGHAFIDLFDLVPKEEKLTSNGLHLTDYGYWRVSAELAKLLGAAASPWSLELHTKDGSYDATGLAVAKIEQGANPAITALPKSLPLPAPPQDAPAKTVAGPSILVNGAVIKSAAVEKAQAQTEKLRQLIGEKNTLFFNRYRPQNETYLFLFRKHEQGNNAVEIPQFEPLIVALEKQIAEVRQPHELRIELEVK